MRLRDGKVHVLQALDRSAECSLDQEVFDFIPALERRERVEVLQEKILPLDRARLRQHFQCLCGPANLVQPRSQGDERFIGKSAPPW